MSYMSLGFMTPTKPAGADEVASFQTSLRVALGGNPTNAGRLECWKAKTLTDAQARAYVSKYNDMNAIYPQAMTAAKFSPCTAGNDQNYRPLSMDEWYKSYYGSKLINIDMTPAVNTVDAGTPGSWNVSGTQKSGSLYGYNFSDQGSAQTYAQAVVDSGGTATMYQVPLPMKEASTAPNVMPPQNQGPTTGSAGSSYTPATPVKGVYVPPPTPINYGVPSTAPAGTAMGPDEVYSNPIIPQEVLQPTQTRATGGYGMMALLAVPVVGAYLWFKSR